MPSGRSKQVIRISLLLCAMYALLAARLYHVQVTESDQLSEVQENLQTRSKYRRGSSLFERPARGAILDRNGKYLAVGFDTYQLLLDMKPGHRPRGRKQKPLTIAQRIHVLSGILNDMAVEHSELEMLEKAGCGTPERGTYVKTFPDGSKKRLPKRGIILLKGLLPWHRDYIKKVMKSQRIVNFGFVPESAREYPFGEVTAEVVGFVGQTRESGDHVQGRGGVERSMEHFLSSTPGEFNCEKDGHGRELELNASWVVKPVLGYDVQLTLDVEIQKIAADALKKGCKKVGCPAGCAVVLDSNTGEILAMSSYPTVSLEALKSGDLEARDFRCRATTDTYEPGSTVKVFFAAKAVEKGIIGWLDEFDTNNGRRVFRSKRRTRVVHDSHPNSVLTTEGVIIESSNIGIAMIGFEKMGYQVLHDALDELELKKSAGIKMPGVGAHKFEGRDYKRPIGPGVSIPFGHAITMTPLALAARFNIFATGGVFHPPVLVKRVMRSEESQENLKRSKRLLREDVADHALDVLEQTVEIGTGKVLKDLPWYVGAKTGTAQRMDKPGRSFNSSIVAIAPVAAPRITVLVVLFDVQGKVVTGGRTAGPIAAEIIRGCLERMGVPKDRDQVGEKR